MEKLFDFPGPGTAMAFAVAVGLYSASVVGNDLLIKSALIAVSFFAIYATFKIEKIHVIKDIIEKGQPTTDKERIIEKIEKQHCDFKIIFIGYVIVFLLILVILKISGYL